MPRVLAELVEGPLDPERYREFVRGPDRGAIALFLGDVRAETGERRTESLFYEAHEAMARRALLGLATELGLDFDAHVALGHRLGPAAAGQTVVVCAAGCAHRAAAFACCQALIERIKRDVPIWKRDGDAWEPGGYNPTGPTA